LASQIPILETAQPEEPYPFWSYQDLVLFIGAAGPSLLASTFAMFVGRKLFPGAIPSKAVEALLAQFLAYGLWFLALYAIFHFRHGKPFWDSLAWSGSTRDVFSSLLRGPVIAILVAMASILIGQPEGEMPIQELLTDRRSLLLVGLFATTLGPLCEELAFRGFLMPLVARSFGPVPGMVLAAAAFALLHGPQYAWSWRHVMLIGLAGMAFGWTRFKTGSTAAATAMHASYNLTIYSGFLLLEGDLLRP
jgi:hypothetical protein